MSIRYKEKMTEMKMDRQHFCMGCMHPLREQGNCPFCDFLPEKYKATPRCLPLGVILENRYLIGKVIGEGSSGITYIGKDLVLNMTIAVKEYFPLHLVSRDTRKELDNNVYVLAGEENKAYQKGLKQFYREAKILSDFHMMDGIVTVRDFFYANKTGYLVMDYINGMTLKKYIRQNGPMSSEDVLRLIKPVIVSLEAVHKEGILHRDISPDNILLTAEGKLILIDFGSARHENLSLTQSLTVMFKRGYTAEEQYRSQGKQGPYSDVYSLCATIYFMMTGIVPNEAIERILKDKLVPLSSVPNVHLSRWQSSVIMKGMEIYARNRYQTMQELNEALYPRRKWFSFISNNGIFFVRHILPVLIFVFVIFTGINTIGHINRMSSDDKTKNPVSASTEPTFLLESSNTTKEIIPSSTTPEATKQETFVSVPDVTNLSVSGAKKRLKQHRLKWKIQYKTTTGKIGIVLRQDKKANSRQKENTVVYLTISRQKGAKKAASVPDSTTSAPVSTSDSTKRSDRNKDDFVATIP